MKRYAILAMYEDGEDWYWYDETSNLDTAYVIVDEAKQDDRVTDVRLYDSASDDYLPMW